MKKTLSDFKAQLADAVETLKIAREAIRAPFDDWKGPVERTALDSISDCLKRLGVTGDKHE